MSRSAYVEFMRKEAADNALSLDGTSFLSRILKVSLIEAGFSFVVKNDSLFTFLLVCLWHVWLFFSGGYSFFSLHFLKNYCSGDY